MRLSCRLARGAGMTSLSLSPKNSGDSPFGLCAAPCNTDGYSLPLRSRLALAKIQNAFYLTHTRNVCTIDESMLSTPPLSLNGVALCSMRRRRGVISGRPSSRTRSAQRRARAESNPRAATAQRRGATHRRRAPSMASGVDGGRRSATYQAWRTRLYSSVTRRMAAFTDAANIRCCRRSGGAR